MVLADVDLEPLRARIEALDRELIDLLAERLDLCREVARLKAVAGVPAHLPDRVKTVIERWVATAAGRKVDPDFVRGVCGMVIAAGTRVQEDEIARAGRA